MNNVPIIPPLELGGPDGKQLDLYSTILNQKHVLIAGTPGSGKSVLLNSLIYTALHRQPCGTDGFGEAGGVNLVLLDQKGNELVEFRNAPHTAIHAVNGDDVISALNIVVKAMESRFSIMMQEKIKTWCGSDIYVVIDEWADLMCTNKKAVVPLIQRICQKGRAARVHVILSTQCLLSKIVPTEIKCCFDSVVALRTASERDSKYIIGIPDCYHLPDVGSCYISTPQFRRPVRYDGIQMVTQAQIQEAIDYWKAPRPMLEQPEIVT